MTTKTKIKPSKLSNFRLQYAIEQTIEESLDPHDFVTEIMGTLQLFNEDTDSYDIPMGELRLRKVEISRAADAGVSLLEIFDSYDDELAEVYSGLFNEKNDFHEHLENVVYPALGSDLLIIERLEIDPRFRKQNLGLLVVARAMDAFAGNCQYVVIKPFPLQFGLYKSAPLKERKAKGFDKFVKGEAAATKKICNHWKKIDFVEVPGATNILITSPAHVRPSQSKLLGKSRKRTTDARISAN